MLHMWSLSVMVTQTHHNSSRVISSIVRHSSGRGMSPAEIHIADGASGKYFAGKDQGLTLGQICNGVNYSVAHPLFGYILLDVFGVIPLPGGPIL